EQVDSKATPVLLNNEDSLIYVDHATPSHGNAEASGRSASPNSPHQLLKETAIIQLQSALKWADMVEDVERDSALINYEEVRNKSGKNRQVHLMKNAKKRTNSWIDIYFCKKGLVDGYGIYCKP
ncbi:hypothetical protein GIB67_005794, partial [Kingdonia uniflora]